MKLPISRIEEGDNKLHFESARDGWVKQLITQIGDKGYRITGPLSIDMNLTKLEPDYYLRGKLETEIEQPCARCAESFKLPIGHSFELGLAHVSHQKAQDPLLSEESEELDVIYFEGPDIDVGAVIEEQFFLSIPYQAVCKESCLGLCQQCGKNRNLGPCECSKGMENSPFSVLKQLKH